METVDCVLCSCEIENTEQVESVLKGVWETLFTELLPQIQKQTLNGHLICDSCYDRVLKLKIFKILFHQNEREIKTRKLLSRDGTVNLRDILRDRGENCSNDDQICRTCLSKIDDKRVENFDEGSPNAALVQDIQFELDLKLISRAVICLHCTENLKAIHHLLQKCLQIGKNSDSQVNENHQHDPEFIQVEYKHIPSTENIDVSKEMQQELPVNLPDLISYNIDGKHAEESDYKEHAEDSDYLVEINKMKADAIIRKKKITYSDLEENCVEYEKGEKIYKCLFCPYNTKRKYNLKSHLECRHGKATIYFECYHCAHRVPTKVQIERHLRVKHSRHKEEHKCPYCDFKATIIEYMRRHIRSQHDDTCNKFTCPHCNFKSKWRSNLRKHISRKHEKNKSLTCPHCDFTTTQRRNYRRHVRSKHLKEDELLRCPECDFKTILKDYLKRHFKYAHDKNLVMYDCELCNYRAKRPGDLRKHIEIIHEKKQDIDGQIYECNQCNYKTLRRKTLAYHVRLHDVNRIFKCTECSYETKFKNNLKIHVQYRHTTVVEMLECTLCSYKAKWKEALKKHMESRHSEKKTLYECSQCEGYKVQHERTLIRHMKSKHSTNSVSYDCNYCDFKTNLPEYLRKHVSYKHNASWLYQCTHCKFKTKGKHILKKHLKRIHDMNECDENVDMVKIKLEKDTSINVDIREANRLDIEFIGVSDVKDEGDRNVVEDHNIENDVGDNDDGGFEKVIIKTETIEDEEENEVNEEEKED